MSWIDLKKVYTRQKARLDFKQVFVRQITPQFYEVDDPLNKVCSHTYMNDHQAGGNHWSYAS